MRLLMGRKQYLGGNRFRNLGHRVKVSCQESLLGCKQAHSMIRGTSIRRPTLAACLISDTACHFSCKHWFFAAYCSVSRSIAKNVLALERHCGRQGPQKEKKRMKSRLATYMNLGGRILVSTVLAVIGTAAAGAQTAPAV